MLTVRVLFYRDDKPPVTLNSCRIKVTGSHTVDDMHSMANDFFTEFKKQYKDLGTSHIGYSFEYRY